MFHLNRTTGEDGRPVFDMVFNPSADAAQQADAGAASVVYAALFTDARAPDGRVADGRRGWWANPDAGCGLWYVRRQPLGGAALLEALEMVRQALAGRAPELTAVSVTDVSPEGSVSAVLLEVAGKHNGRPFQIGLTL